MEKTRRASAYRSQLYWYCFVMTGQQEAKNHERQEGHPPAGDNCTCWIK
nr:MAG TPA: hypothetical protein [Caudoviricetes sp.]